MLNPFQPTLPHGERQLCRYGWRRTGFDFNPRSRTGSDGFAHKTIFGRR